MTICQIIKDAVSVPKDIRKVEKLEIIDYRDADKAKGLLNLGLLREHTTFIYDIEKGDRTPVKHYVYTRTGRIISIFLEKIGYA